MRLLSLLLLCLAPWLHCAGLSPIAAYAHEMLSGRALLPVEGVWQFPDDGAVILIHRTSASTFDITLLDSPDLSAPPGMPIGTARTTPTAGVYDATLDGGAIPEAGGKTASLRVADGTLSIHPYTQGWTVSLQRLFYRIFKVSVSKRDTRPGGLDGAVRVYPSTPSAISPLCL